MSEKCKQCDNSASGTDPLPELCDECIADLEIEHQEWLQELEMYVLEIRLGGL